MRGLRSWLMLHGQGVEEAEAVARSPGQRLSKGWLRGLDPRSKPLGVSCRPESQRGVGGLAGDSRHQPRGGAFGLLELSLLPGEPPGKEGAKGLLRIRSSERRCDLPADYKEPLTCLPLPTSGACSAARVPAHCDGPVYSGKLELQLQELVSDLQGEQ